MARTIWTHTDPDNDHAEIEDREDGARLPYSLLAYEGADGLCTVHLDRAGLAALRDAINVELAADEPHLIQLRADGFTIQHPLRCRPNLFACPVNTIAHLDTGPPAQLGVFECEPNETGDRLLIGERVGGED